MSEFAMIDTLHGQISDKRYPTMAEALAEAQENVTDNPDTEVEIIQVLKRVSSSVKIDVVDVA